MRSISPPDHDFNPADPATALRQKRDAFAAGVARHEFGAKNYCGEDHDGFVDRAPGELALARAIRWRHGSDVDSDPTPLARKRARLFSGEKS